MNYQTFNEPYTFKEPYITNKNRGTRPIRKQNQLTK